MIEKHNAVADKAVLLDMTAQNQHHREKRTFVLYGDARADCHVCGGQMRHGEVSK